MLFIGENGSPEIRSKATAKLEAHDKWMELPPCEHEQMMLDGCTLGNAGFVSIVRDMLAVQEEDNPVLLGKVFYSGTHCGDHLGIRDVRRLAVELDRLEESELLGTAPAGQTVKEIRAVIRSLRRMATVALSIHKPLRSEDACCGGRMEKTRDSMSDELRPEYDLSELLRGGVRGKYAKRYHAGTNLVLLDPDVRKGFRDEKAVNDALRLVIELRKVGSRGRRAKRG